MPDNYSFDNNNYASLNLLHCFAINAVFTQMLRALDPHEIDSFSINEENILDFLFGSRKKGKIKHHVHEDLPMNIYFCLKVNT